MSLNFQNHILTHIFRCNSFLIYPMRSTCLAHLIHHFKNDVLQTVQRPL